MLRCLRSLCSGLIAFLFVFSFSRNALAQTSAFSIRSVNFYGNNYSTQQSVGFEFKPLTNIAVSSLGFFDYQGDGLGENHEVGIFDSTRTLLASVIIPAGTSGLLDGDFRYLPIPPVILRAEARYTIAALLLTRADTVGYSDVFQINLQPDLSVPSYPSRYALNSGGHLIFPLPLE